MVSMNDRPLGLPPPVDLATLKRAKTIFPTERAVILYRGIWSREKHNVQTIIISCNMSLKLTKSKHQSCRFGIVELINGSFRP